MTFSAPFTGDRYQEEFWGTVTRWLDLAGVEFTLPVGSRYTLKDAAPPPPAGYVAPTPPAPDPPEDSTPDLVPRRQWYEALFRAGICTRNEALAGVCGATVPPALATVVATLPTVDLQFRANMILRGEPVMDRQHPLMDYIGKGLGWTAAQGRQFWRMAGALP